MTPEPKRGWLRNLLTSGITKSLVPEQEMRLLFINSVMLMGFLILLYFGLRDFAENQVVLGISTLGLAVFVAGVFFYLRISHSLTVALYIIPVILGLFFSYLTITGGAGSSGVIWMVTYPLVSIFLLGGLGGGIFAGVFLTINVVLLFAPGLSAVTLHPDFKSRIVGAYVLVMIFSLAFENIRRKAQLEIEESRFSLAEKTSALLDEKKQTDGIMTHVQEGIFLLDRTLRLEPQYSRILEELLGETALAGRPVIELLRGKLPDRALTAVEDYLGMFFIDRPDLRLLEEINPLEKAEMIFKDSSVREKFLEFRFSLIRWEDGTARVLGTVRDMTEAFFLSRRLKAEEDKAATQMKSLFQILHVRPELMRQFLEDAEEEIESVNFLLKSQEKDKGLLLTRLFQAVHAVKGNAVLLGLEAFSLKAHAMEDKISAQTGQDVDWKFFLEIALDLSQLQGELTELHGLVEKMSAYQKDLADETRQEDLLAMSLKNALDKAAKEHGKSARLDVGGSLNVPANHRKLIKDVLVQMIRNSLAHGIEKSEDRVAAGKPSVGTVSVSSQATLEHWIIRYRDDGQGLQPEKILAHARRHPLLAKMNIDKLTPGKVLGLVFHPGFSTSDEVSMTAGRGMGMGLIKDRVEKVGGKLKIRSNPGKSLMIEVTLPLS